MEQKQSGPTHEKERSEFSSHKPLSPTAAENSELVQAYLMILPQSLALLDKQQCEFMLHQNRIVKLSCLSAEGNHKHIAKVSCVSKQQINHSQMTSVQITVSTFRFQITMLNVKGKNPLLRFMQSKRGNFGCLYFLNFLNEMTAIKIFRVVNEALLPACINSAIKQYGIAKLCSALKCGPFLNNIFGFDLIVYDDSVMFSLEKCQQLHAIKHQTTDMLKKSMKLMHNFGIIHLDVKPDNIMYSPTYRKPVFIDFGFSQIVELSLGKKMQINFRGSPAYCSEQMLVNLGLTNAYNCVDVYYNDALGLEHSIRFFKAETKFADWISQPDLLCLDEETQDIFLIYLFKYNCFTKKSSDIVRLLRLDNNSLLQKQGKQILNIFEKTVSAGFFEIIYSELHKQIHKFIESSTIETFFKCRTFAVRGNPQQPEYDQDHITGFGKRLDIYLKQSPRNLLLFERYREFLVIQNIFCSPLHFQQARHILIQFLRFDVKNSNLVEKSKVALAFNASQGIYVNSQEHQASYLLLITSAFRLLFQYCLSSPCSMWKRDHLFIIITQLVMLDFNFQPYVDKMILHLRQLYISFNDRIRCSIQLSKLSNLQQLKHITDHQFMKVIFPYKILIQCKKMLQQALQAKKDSQDLQTRSILTVFKLFVGLKDPRQSLQIYSRIRQQLNQVKDDDFREYLLQFLYLQLLVHYQEQQRYESTCQLLHNIQDFPFYKSFQQKSHIFHFSAYYIVKILILTKDIKELQRFLAKITDIIGCSTILEKFKFQMCIFLFSYDQDTQKLNIFSESILQCPNYLSTRKLSLEFSALINKITSNGEFVAKYPEVVQRIFQTFAAINKSLEPDYADQLTTGQIEKIMYRYNIISFYTEVLPLFTRGNLVKQVSRLQSFLKNEQIIKARRLYMTFQLLIYQALYFYCVNNYLRVLQCFQSLYLIVKGTKDKKTQNYFLKKIIMTALRLELQDKILPYIYQLWNISHEIAELTRYFQIDKCYFITMSLHQFQRNNDLPTFYRFLVAISEYINKFPFEKHFDQWVVNMSLLMKKQKYLQLMNFEVLSNIFKEIGWRNHYFVTYFIFSLEVQPNKKTQQAIFIKIVNNLPFLHGFAKNTILKKYFLFAIPYFLQKERKATYLLLRWGLRYLQRKAFWRWQKPKLARLKRLSEAGRQFIVQKLQQAIEK